MSNNGILLCATGNDTYIHHCNTIISDIKDVMPDITIAVFTDKPIKIQGADILIDGKVEVQNFFMTKIWAIKKSPFDKTIFLDVDCRLLNPIYEIFSILDLYDVAICFADGRDNLRDINYNPSETGIPLSSSTFAFKKTNSILELFNEWEADYQNGIYFPNRGDQGYLARLLYIHSEIKKCILTNEYRFNVNIPQVAGGIIKVITGLVCDNDSRGQLSRENLDKLLNNDKRIRLIKITKSWFNLFVRDKFKLSQKYIGKGLFLSISKRNKSFIVLMVSKVFKRVQGLFHR